MEGAGYVNLPEHIVIALRAVLKRFNSYANQDAFFEQIYLDDAPFVFMPSYKFHFLLPLKSYVDTLKSYVQRMKNQKTLDGLFISFGHAEDPLQRIFMMKNALYECELKTPNIADFDPFKELFSSFVSDADLVLEDTKKHLDGLLLRRHAKRQIACGRLSRRQ